MKISVTLYKLLLFLFAIYAIAAVQFVVNNSAPMFTMRQMSYYDKITPLEASYYKNNFYKYSIWLDGLIPKDVLFSIYHDKRTNQVTYNKYVHRLTYYMYPRYAVTNGTSKAVFAFKVSDMRFRNTGNIKSIFLNNNSYILVAVLDDKGLLLERSFIKRSVLNNTSWKNVHDSFKELYGVSMEKADI